MDPSLLEELRYHPWILPCSRNYVSDTNILALNSFTSRFMVAGTREASGPRPQCLPMYARFGSSFLRRFVWMLSLSCGVSCCSTLCKARQRVQFCQGGFRLWPGNGWYSSKACAKGTILMPAMNEKNNENWSDTQMSFVSLVQICRLVS